MGFRRYASLDVLDSHLARPGEPLLKDAHRHEFNYTPKPGFLYCRSRAISSRCNDNFDDFPADEIRQGWRTFIGKPVFVNHHNSDPKRARGVIVDAALHEDMNPDGTEDVWVETLHEIDARKFPKLCQAILAGESDRTSMGTNVEYSLCSVCGNKAFTPLDYCQHIPRMKGQRIYRHNASTGEREGVLVREICYGLSFFENSHLVEDPADPTAYVLGIDARGLETTASRRHAILQPPPDKLDWVSVLNWYIDYFKGKKDPNDPTGRMVDPDAFSYSDIAYGINRARNRGSGLLDEAFRDMNRTDIVKLVNRIHDEMPLSERTQGAVERWVYDHADEIIGVRSENTQTGQGSMIFPHGAKTAAKLGYGETLAPADVDTLRDAACPVCGEEDSYNGDECLVCNFKRPPDQFLDPDLEKAQQVDLRQDAQEEAAETADGFPGSDQPLDHFIPPDSNESVDEEEQVEDEEQDDDEPDEDPDDPSNVKKKDKKKSATPPKQSHREGVDVTMRPTLAALAEQQIVQENQQAQIDAIARLAGVDLSKIKANGTQRIAALRVKADENNPAQPIPDPGAEAPAQTTQDALAPDGRDNPEAIGASPVTDVSADATTDVQGLTTVLDEPLDLNEQDPTKPVSGTESMRPLDEVRTETDVQVKPPTNEVAFPLEGEFARQPSLGSSSEARFVASLRLARLRIMSDIAEGDDDIALATGIDGSDMSDGDIAGEIATLSKVVTAQRNGEASRTATRRLVPQPAQPPQTRQAPSMSPVTGSLPSQEQMHTSALGVSNDELLFEAD